MTDQAGLSLEGVLTQDGRRIAIDTPLGPDKLLLTAISGQEQLSTLFSFDTTMISLDQSIAPGDLVGRNVTIWITMADGDQAPLNGYVKTFHAGRIVRQTFREYKAQVVPWLWFLTRTTDCRIFQETSVPDAISTIFVELGFRNFDMTGLTGTYPKLDYIVQYRETAFDFVSRWMEEVGIFYYFRHSGGQHVMVLGDNNASFKPASEDNVGVRNGLSRQISDWQHGYNFRSGRWTQKDFNFETPKHPLLSKQATLVELPNLSAYERFDYPGRYEAQAQGETLTRVRIEEEEAGFHTVSGSSVCASFRTGLRFFMATHDIPAEAGKAYILTGITHHASDSTYFGEGSVSEPYRNDFVAVPVQTRYRPQRTTPRPFVHGPQTAIVVGPSGETIFPDKYGRVKLQFHWDRRGKHDERSSCWVRVAQPWGGGGWGGMFLPHVGHEVVVSFLEGDPDRPLVTGRVYNADSMQAVALPTNKTHSAWRDHSGNEILMEGKGGVQDVRITAVKDMNVKVKNDYNDVVVSGNRSIKVQTGTHTEDIKGDTKITIHTGSLTVTVAANTAHYESKSTTTVLSTTADVHVQAETQIALDCGDSHILMKKDGTISINGKNITVHGSESVSIKGNAIRSIADQEHETVGAITVSEGKTTNTVKGAMVMLNPGT